MKSVSITEEGEAIMANKEKMAVWLRPETKELMKKHLDEANAGSMSEFIEKAIRYFCGRLDCNTPEAIEYLASAVHGIIDSSIKGSEQRLSRLLFKVAVEGGKLSHITAAVNDVDEEEIDKLQSMCIDEVRRLNGIIQFENAYKYQKS